MAIKKFQENTINAVINSFKNHDKVLVADEVGLGKTIIAREVINRFCSENPNKVHRTIYLCSNQNIINQNIQKLNLGNDVLIERLSMQSINLYNEELLKNNKRQILPITIGTSIITKGTGTRRERVFMYLVINQLDTFANFKYELKEIIENGKDRKIAWENKSRFDIEIEWTSNLVENLVNNNSFKNSFLKRLEEKLKEEKMSNVLLEKCKQIRSEKGKNTANMDNSKISDKLLNISNNEIIKKLRRIFVEVTLADLKPDLIIMDEFQNFRREILQADQNSDTGMIVKQFLQQSDEKDNPKILLLSATPYKLYSTLAEIDENNEDEAFNSFFEVVNFLLDNKKERDNFKKTWNEYSNLLINVNTASEEKLLYAKNKVENILNKVIYRTEKTNKMQPPSDSIINVHKNDIKTYAKIENALKKLDGFNFDMSLEYVKSCPYPLSFIQDYNIKKELEKYFKIEDNKSKIKELNERLLWINKEDINNYREIENVNSRFNRLKEKIFDNMYNIEKLLWLPPTKPYYQSKTEKRTNVYTNAEGASKMLIFSNWAIVPRMISTLISYEEERRRVQCLKDYNTKYSYTNLDDSFKNKEMTFNVDKGKANSMRLMSLIYPSEKLATLYEPKHYLNIDTNSVPDIEKIEKEISDKIKDELEKIIEERGMIIRKDGAEDRKWYYIAPVILDANINLNWLDNCKKELKKNSNKEDDDTGLCVHLDRLREIINSFKDNNLSLGRMPDDLYDVLAKITIASPSICAYRSILAVLTQNMNTENNNIEGKKNESIKEEEYSIISEKKKIAKIAGIKFGKLIFNLFNSTEAMTIIQGNYVKSAYWKNVLQYCEDGNLQAILDEYIHLISENIVNCGDEADRIMNIISEAMGIRTTREIVDTFSNFENRVKTNDKNDNKNDFRMKLHFAVGFYQSKVDEKSVNRKENIRTAFNSPFRPFVLASTSVGQEGLDFHYYCRKISHWNLPHNPIDISQRDGRINRYKCLAIRKYYAENIMQKFKTNDIWKEIFECTDTNDNNGLIPYWCLPEGKELEIERNYFLYENSEEINKYNRINEILKLYKITLGQPRQEELIDNIKEQIGDSKNINKYLIDLKPKENN